VTFRITERFFILSLRVIEPAGRYLFFLVIIIREVQMALYNFSEPKSGMSSAFPMNTVSSTGSSDDLKAMALGIQAWFDGSSALTPVEPGSVGPKRRTKATKQSPDRK
jgi:hypothetical protein